MIILRPENEMIGRFVLLFLWFAAPAAARCVTAANLVEGVMFTRAGGQEGSVKSAGRNDVEISYRHGEREHSDRRTARLGICVTSQITDSFPSDVIGVWSETGSTFAFQGSPPVPRPGETWETMVRVEQNTTDFAGMPQRERGRFGLQYVFLDLQEVTLDGCSYRMIPVEPCFDGEVTMIVQRQAYFPDLGSGIETLASYPETGVVNTNGIVSLRPAAG